MVLCSGVGAIVVKNVLSIPYGKCMNGEGASFLTGGGKISLTSPIVVALVYVKPTHVDIFKLMMFVSTPYPVERHHPLLFLLTFQAVKYSANER